MSTKQIAEPRAAGLPPHTAPLSSPSPCFMTTSRRRPRSRKRLLYTSHGRPAPVHSYEKGPRNLTTACTWNPIFVQGKTAEKKIFFFLTAIELTQSRSAAIQHSASIKLLYFIRVRVNTNKFVVAFSVACMFFYPYINMYILACSTWYDILPY